MLYQDLLLIRLENQKKYLHLTEYHVKGYTGKNIVILNTESLDGHGQMTTKVINDFSPDAKVINSPIGGRISNGVVLSTTLTIDGEIIDFEDAIEKYKIKIVTTSITGNNIDARLEYFKDIQRRKGTIFVNSAGNDPDEVTGIYTKNDCAIAVGAAKLLDDCVTIERYNYSAQGEELDFMSFLARGEGTSAASPGLAGIIACLLDKYGDFNQVECVEILKSISIGLGDSGKDIKYGWGLPVLPLTDKLEILEKLRGVEEMQFKDVEDTRWSKAAIDRCVDEGLLVGFEDGTFRPTETVTREQFATILTRILDKIEGRQ